MAVTWCLAVTWPISWPSTAASSASESIRAIIPRVRKMNPPGAAKALGVGSSTTPKVHGSCGRSDSAASRVPSPCTYPCSALSCTSPIACTACEAVCLPISISCPSLTSASWSCPVTGFRAHPCAPCATASSATSGTQRPLIVSARIGHLAFGIG